MLKNYWKLAAVVGLFLTALSLNGSTRASAGSIADSSLAAEIRADYEAGSREYDHGSYLQARAFFLAAASLAQCAGDLRSAASNWNNAGGSALARLDYRDALADFMKARQSAQASREFAPLAMTLNNLASLYLQMGNPLAAAQIAREALASPAGSADSETRSKLGYQLAGALARINRFDEAEGIYREVVDELKDQGDLDTTARTLASLGSAALDANRIEDADGALSEALMLVRLHHLTAAAKVLCELAKVKTREGDVRSARFLFDAAISAPQYLTPRWTLYADRAQFRLDHSDLRGALDDFREAHRLATVMRVDIVPADQDRVALEGVLSGVGAGLVEAGNRLAKESSDRGLLRETFDAAEQDRLWSLRALLPAADDWRTHLPENYWDLLARYQANERLLMIHPSPELQKRASAMQLELQEIEAGAAGRGRGPESAGAQSALEHVRSVLDADSVLFSFHIAKSGGWVWAVDRTGVDVYPIPSLEELKSRVAEFALATRKGDPRAVAMGKRLYNDLFGCVPASFAAHKRWLLELDGPLFDLPFAALVVGNNDRKDEPVYLIERAALQTIPAALMLDEPQAVSADGGFLGIGDPVYNAADIRYRGPKRSERNMVLPRLPATATELLACSRAWGSKKTNILMGRDADIASVRTALEAHPAIIHFATHVVTAPGDHSSGLIALSLDPAGAMGLMGPTEIVAHPVSARLIVLNGCHSGQGEALPGAGLMGLTRAWIGAGARSVLATGWDIPDEAGKTLMVDFYRAARAHPERGAAFGLQEAQLAAIRQYERNTPAIWAAYFLLGRE